MSKKIIKKKIKLSDDSDVRMCWINELIKQRKWTRTELDAAKVNVIRLEKREKELSDGLKYEGVLENLSPEEIKKLKKEWGRLWRHTRKCECPACETKRKTRKG